MARLGRAQPRERLIRPLRAPPNSTTRSSVYSITDFGTAVPAGWTLAGSTGSPLNVDTHRLNLTTSAAGAYADFTRADLTDAATTSLTDFDVYTSFEITNPLAEQYVSFFARSSNDWNNGDSPGAYVGSQITSTGGRCFLFARVAGGPKITVAERDFVGGFPMVAGAVYWHRFRGAGNWLWAKWWTGLISDEPANWSIDGDQTANVAGGRFKIYQLAGNAAAAANLYIRSFDVGDTSLSNTDLSVTGSLFAGSAPWATVTGDRSVTALAPAGTVDYLSAVGVGLSGVLEAGSATTATASGDRTVTANVPADGTARLGTVGVGLSGVVEVGTAPQAPATADLPVTGTVPAEATARLGAVGVGLSGLLEVGDTANLATVGVGLTGVVEAGATARLPTVGVGLAGLLEAGPSSSASATRDATVTALVPAGESASLGTIGVGLAGLLEAGATGRLGTIGVGLPGLLEAGTIPRATTTAVISVAAIVPAAGVLFSPATLTASLAGLLPIGASGSELVGTVAIINVAGLALAGVTARATATLGATATGLLEAGATTRATATANLAPVGYVDVGATASGLVTTALTVNVAGLTLIGAAARATTTADLAPVGFLCAGATDRAAVAVNLTAAGFLAAGLRAGATVAADLAVAAQLLTGSSPFATVTRSTTTTGWVALGTTANGTLVVVFRAADERLIVVRGELRTVGVEGDDRLVVVYGTPRVVAVEGEQRIIPATPGGPRVTEVLP